jgi:hypothetical protein
MAASLPSKLAFGLILLSAMLMATLYTVHKTPSFQTNLPNWILDTPTGMGLQGSSEKRDQNRREMREQKHQPVVEEVEEEDVEEEKNRKPMNIILFYADDWRHDVSCLYKFGDITLCPL